MRLCKILITMGAAQCGLGLGGIEKLEGLPDAIVAVRLPVIGHRCGCYKEQHNRQETCNQPFFHVFLLPKFLAFPVSKTAGRRQRARARRLIGLTI